MLGGQLFERGRKHYHQQADGRRSLLTEQLVRIYPQGAEICETGRLYHKRTVRSSIRRPASHPANRNTRSS